VVASTVITRSSRIDDYGRLAAKRPAFLHYLSTYKKVITATYLNVLQTRL